MLVEIKNPVTSAGSGFYKHVCKLPQNPNAQKTIIAIQINLSPPQDAKVDPSVMAIELKDCLSAVDPEILRELKKLLPES